MSASRGTRSKQSIRSLLSLALFGIAAILFIIVGVLRFRDDNQDPQIAPTPIATPGHLQVKSIFDALAAQDLKVAYAHAAGPRFKAISPPAQGLTVDGYPLYIFIYEDPDLREEETASLTAADPAPTSARGTSGTPTAAGTPHGVGGSNVYAVLLGGDDEVTAKVDRAIQGLP